MRLVDVLKRKGNVVSMTGDGVNDAPALKRSDIGVAMGITGTEVTKEAADMILTDDNFATIVAAVEGGRGIYDNLMKYVRVQLVMLGGFILTFVGAGIFDIAGGAPLTPLQILWINFAVDVLLAIGLGFDASAPGLMRRAPRDASAPIVDRALGIRLAVASVIMAALALGVVAWGEDRYDLVVATTMGLTTLSLMHIVGALEARELTGTIFSRYTIANRRFVQLIGAALVLTFLVTVVDGLNRIFDTARSRAPSGGSACSPRSFSSRRASSASSWIGDPEASTSIRSRQPQPRRWRDARFGGRGCERGHPRPRRTSSHRSGGPERARARILGELRSVGRGARGGSELLPAHARGHRLRVVLDPHQPVRLPARRRRGRVRSRSGRKGGRGRPRAPRRRPSGHRS